jgi:hypothetical protein
VTGRLAALLLAVVAGCDAQVDGSYPGQAVIRLQGTAIGFGVEEVEAAAIVWNQNRGHLVPSGPIAAQPMHPVFPAALTISILAPPPDEAYFGVDGETSSIAEGYLHLVGAGAGDDVGVDDFVGAAVDLVLVHVRGEVDPAGLLAAYLGGARSPGFHLLGWRATAELSDAQAYFTERCAEQMVADGILTADVAQSECRFKRLYRLIDSSDGIDTRLQFYPWTGP